MDNVKLWLDDNGDIDDKYTNYITSSAYTEPYVGYVPASPNYIRGQQGTPANVFFNASSSQKSHDDACAGDIVYAKDDGSKMYAPYQYDAYWQKKGWKAIAAVVVPARYTPDGTIRAMSLVNMDCETPETGGITGPKENGSSDSNTNGQNCLRWGSSGFTVAKNTTNKVSTINPKGDSTTIGINYYAQFPRDHKYGGTISGNSGDADAWWWQYTPAAPSPYGNQFAYSKEGQVLADMDGRGNTDTVLKHVPTSAFTMTDTLSPNVGETGDTETFNVPENYPAFTLCARYHTTGTEAAKFDSSGYKSLGSWYLPSAGELGYLVVRDGLIFNACENVKVDGTQHHGYGIYVGGDYTTILDKSALIHYITPPGRPGGCCWSSSESVEKYSWLIGFDDGGVDGHGHYTKDDRAGWLRVRAFAAF